MIDLAFPRPKDPEDEAWYLFRAPEPVASASVTATESTPTDTDGTGSYSTPGDMLTGTDLSASSVSVPTSDVTTSDGKTIPAGLAISFKLSGGKPGLSYAVRARFITVSGSTLNRSVILPITGL
jgi:hypothetical protein